MTKFPRSLAFSSALGRFRRVGSAPSVLLFAAGLAGCGGPLDAASLREDTTLGGESASWVEVGAPDEFVMRDAPESTPVQRRTAAEAWTGARTEENAMRLADAYFPEMRFYARALEKDPLVNHGADLSVEAPEREGAPMQITTRGLSFTITQTGATGAEAEEVRGAAFYGSGHYITPLDGDVSARGWRTQRVEEYHVVAGGEGEHHERFDVTVPEGVTAVRDAKTYLEFLDGANTPVLRMYYIVARDAEGHSRQGDVRLDGVRAAGQEGEATYSIVDSTLSVSMSVGLEGMTGPVVVDPGWASTGSMATTRVLASTTLLPSGKVLVAGGWNEAAHHASAELYDPAAGVWSSAGTMGQARGMHSAVVLPSGKVLVAGGQQTGAITAAAQLYDPSVGATGSWTSTGSMNIPRDRQTTTLLPNGKVLVIGGFTTGTVLTGTAELYNPATGTWSYTASLPTPRESGAAALLPNGKVLFAGGAIGTTRFANADLYDPATGTFSATGSLAKGRSFHTLTLLHNGKVLAAGGKTALAGDWATAELYNPATGTWSSAASMATGRSFHGATLLPSGKVLLMGGDDVSGAVLASTESYDPATNTWSSSTNMTAARLWPQATLLPSGKVLVSGGWSQAAGYLSGAELHSVGAEGWTGTGAMTVARAGHSATILPNGKVLVAGGTNLASADVFDPATGTWTATGAMPFNRKMHPAVSLPSGKVLVSGGEVQSPGTASSSVLYDPNAGTWSTGNSMNSGRNGHTLTLLPNGKVLAAGGAGWTASAELYDPAIDTWTTLASMFDAHSGHTATLLPSGKVLLIGGGTPSGTTAKCEAYDFSTGTWIDVPDMSFPRRHHTATLLPNGKVLVAGGFTSGPGGGMRSEVAIFTPSANGTSGTWANTTSMGTARMGHRAALLPSGRVLVAGGFQPDPVSGFQVPSNTAEIFDPATSTWTPVNMSAKRGELGMTLLPSGQVLAAGGTNPTAQSSAELFDESDSISGNYLPVVNAPTTVTRNVLFTVTGTNFRGFSEGSSGYIVQSPTNFPLVTLWSLEGGAPVRLPGSNMSATSVQATAPLSLLPGRYMLTVTTNGLSGGRVVQVN